MSMSDYFEDEGPVETAAVDPEAEAAKGAALERVDEVSGQVQQLGELPSVGAWEKMCLMAVTFAQSSLVPRAMFRKPADVLLILVTAHDMGIGVTSALSQCYVIDGKVTISPKLRLALLNNSGRGTVRPHKDNTAEWACAEVFGKEMADGSRTKIGEMALTRADVPSALFSKQNWKDYPKNMMWARVLGYAIDAYFPEAGIGLYSADELGAVTNEDGEPIDLTTVEAAVPATSPREAAPERPEEPKITDETLSRLNEMMARIATDDAVKAEAGQLWVKRFEKQPRRSFTQKQGLTAVKLMQPFADKIVDDAVVVEEDTGPPACKECGKPADSVENPEFCSNCAPF